jgi:hypothetical protein
MKLKRWYAIPAAGLAAVIVGVAAVEAAPSPSPSPSGTTNYAQVFLEKLANILHLTPSQTQADIKQAQLQTVDQMLKDGKITQAEADALKARINGSQGLGPLPGPGFGFHGYRNGNFGAYRTLMMDLRNAELNAAASALHMTTADFQSALRSGKSLADLETQQKVSDSSVQAAVKNAAKGVLDKAVQAKTITQAQEDAILSKIGSAATFGHRHFPGGPFGPAGLPVPPVPPITPAWYAPTI